MLHEAKRLPQLAYGLSKLVLHKVRRRVLTEIDRMLDRILGRNRLLQKEAAKYDYYYRAQGRISDVGFRLALDKCCEHLEFRSVLDVGCGNGFSVLEFLRRGYRALGTDISAYVVANPIPELRGQGHLLPAPASRLPFADNSFDLVFCTDVMEHVPEREVQPAILEMRRVSSRYLLLTIATVKSSALNPIEYHATVRPRVWWEARFEKAGLRAVEAVLQAIQGSEVYKVGKNTVPVEYFVYEKVGQ